MSSPISAIDTRLELFGYPPRTTYAKWGSATWGSASNDGWYGQVWNDIACEVTALSIGWGADDALGVLAQSAAGSIELETYDPDGLLDPANPSSSVDIGMRQTGTPFRVRSSPATGSWTVDTGYLDELTWSAADGTGRLSGSDAIAQLAAAQTTARFALPGGPSIVPPALYALVGAIVADTGLPIPVATFAADFWPADPQVAFPARKAQGVNAWQAIKAAAIDALAFAWVDRFGTLRFSPLGAVSTSSVILGDGGIALADLDTTRTARGVYNVVVDQVGEIARDAASVKTYGPRTVSISDRREPAGAAWAGAILADRAFATLEVAPGRIIPKSSAEFAALVQLRAGQSVAIHLLDPARDLTGTVLGGGYTATPEDGWRVSLRLYVPGSAWTYIPPAPSVVVGTPAPLDNLADRDAYTYISGPKDSRPNEYRGAGGDSRLYANGNTGLSTSDYDNGRMFIHFALNLDGVRRVTKAELYLNDAQQLAGSPSLDFLPILEDWPEGYTQTTPTTSSPIIWPGPACDTSRVITLPAGTITTSSIWNAYDLTALIRPWLPVELGGDAAPQYGLCVKLTNETVDQRVIALSREYGPPLGGYAPRIKYQEV